MPKQLKLQTKTLLIIGIASILAMLAMGSGLALNSSEPVITGFSPDGTTQNYPGATVSFSVYDPDEIAGSNYFIKVNGTPINSSITYAGHWEYYYDTCSSSSWFVVDDWRQATISGWASGLKDGPQTVEVQAQDKLGNVVTKTWNFNVAIKPVISNLQPVSGANLLSNTLISAKVSDNGTVDPNSIVLLLDNNQVQHTFDKSTGIISYNSQAPMPDGIHTVKLNASDVNGNPAQTAQWSFTVQSVGPALTFADADKKFTTGQPIFSLIAKSNVTVSDKDFTVKIDGQSVSAVMNYAGHIEYDEWSDDSWWVVDDYSKATYSYRPAANLVNGDHTITLTSKDILGNTSTRQWAFKIAVPPVISGVSPTGFVFDTPALVKGIISSNNGSNIDLNSISMSIDNNRVVHQVVYDNLRQVTVSYSADNLSDDKSHTIKLSAVDELGSPVSTSWSFYGMRVGSGTGFIGQSPVSETVYKTNPTISVHFTDREGKYNVNGASVYVDGLTPIEWATGYDPDEGEYSYSYERRPVVTGTQSEYIINYYPAPLADGMHTVSINIPSTDGVSPPATASWSFEVKVPPVIEQVAPTRLVATNVPIIVTYSSDNNAFKADGSGDNKAPASFSKGELVIDNGAPILMQIDKFNSREANINGRMSYKLITPLSDGVHTAKFSVYDSAGNTSTKEWSFRVDTNTGTDYPDMPFTGNTGDTTCRNCHKTATPAEGGTHPDVNKCYMCHTPKIWASGYFNYCTFCHYDNRPSNYNQYFTWRHTSDGYSTFENIDFLRHDLKSVHLSETTGCEKCHSRLLTDEHNRPGRTDINGNQVNCDTCHLSANSIVKTSITNKDTRCSACHTAGDHEKLHDSGFDEKCQSCHDSNLSKEHREHPKRSDGRDLNCEICHNNLRPEVKRTISTGNLNCAGCHRQAHTLTIAEIKLGDVPLYSGFKFTTPMEAAIFTGEAVIPAGYLTGQVMVSNRRADITSEQVWTFYNEALTAKGYSIKSGAYVTGAASFNAEFTSSTRAVVIRCYNTATAAGGQAVGGYRIEIWHK